MSGVSGCVEAVWPVLLDDGDVRIPLSARIDYRADRAFEVTMTFFSGRRPITTWVFARDLLLDGLTSFAGEGDVLVGPVWARTDRGDRAERRICIGLSSPDGECRLTVAETDVALWCRRMVDLVPRGRESHHCDMDEELRQFLG
ncbi:SsgA family sporulation/cell division regulator [Streptomyces sp. NPDC059917]|uniref:SsgA family sporulation/cell division regulator n=1 Tax=Streptomyces sp. NPDC059917 TaxID=3347002 RepID=UPI003657F390